MTRSLELPPEELRWRFDTSGGPGGQHANRSRTAAEVFFDVTASRTLGPRQRDRLLQRLGPVVSAAASEERSQARNRELALERLAAKLAVALSTPPRRRPTAPPPAAAERRLEQKRRRGELKRERSSRPLSGDGADPAG